MLLRFTSPDMLNTLLIDATTGRCAYEIVTATVPPSDSIETESPLASSSTPMSSSSFASASSKQRRPSSANPQLEQRRTTIKDPSGNILVDVKWNGRHPHISIGDENVGGLTDLFGSSTIRFMPKILAVPTRFDTEFVWTSTADSLTLFDYDSETTKGTFHQNCIRIPTPAKLPKLKLSSPSKLHLSSPSSLKLSFLSSKANLSSPSKLTFSLPPLSPIDEPLNSPLKPKSPLSSLSSPHLSSRSTFIPTHIPGVGCNYLEFTPHPLAPDVEIILSFLMMEILRRGRFCLTPYTFDRPRMWQLKEARDLFIRRLRRNTA